MQQVQLNLDTTTSQPVQYHDLYLRLAACMLGTHILIVYGETKSTLEMLLTPAYYYAFIGSFIIAFILVSVVRQTFIRLDKVYDWMVQPLVRCCLQLLFGLVIPGILALILAALYFKVRGYNILHTSYLRYDFQFILLQLLLINIYYLAYYFYGRSLQSKSIIENISKTNKVLSNPVLNETFQVSRGLTTLLLPIDEIAYCFRIAESNFLRTIAGEDFFISQSLDEIQQQLPKNKFFRINRQMIAHRQTCKSFDLLSYGKLKTQLQPAYNEEVIISQKRALAFKNWLDGGQ
jgi:hypothetical protein